MTKFHAIIEVYHKLGLVPEDKILDEVKKKGIPINNDTRIKAVSARKAYVSQLKQELTECIELSAYSTSKKHKYAQRLVFRRINELNKLIVKEI